MLNPTIKRYLIQATLFLVTVITVSYAGGMNMGLPADSYTELLLNGLQYAIPFLGILTAHEFGHYLVARYYKVKSSLPYYIPFILPFAGMPQLGTFGAFIKMEGKTTRKQMFDIGIAGPLAGFVVALLVLTYAFTHLPEREYIYQVHPEYAQAGPNYEEQVFTLAFWKKQEAYQQYLAYRQQDSLRFLESKHGGVHKTLRALGLTNDTWSFPEFEIQEVGLGSNLLFMFFETYVVDDPSKIPHKYEMYHYPLLFAAYMALFFTALNLIPVGQLDGGHVIYGLFGPRWHRRYVPIIFAVYVSFGGIGIFKDNILGVNFFQAEPFDMLLFGAAYLYFLYYMFSRAWSNKRTALMVATIVFTIQFLIEFSFPQIKGFSGWYLFAFIIARFLGVHHPRMLQDEPLDLKRKVLGWLCLLIFVLSFSPEVLTIEVLK